VFLRRTASPFGRGLHECSGVFARIVEAALVEPPCHHARQHVLVNQP